VTLTLADRFGPFSGVRDLWQQSGNAKVSGRGVEVSVEDRNVAVLRLE
jgi:hypothetical protein